jgi:toluene monooxygenase system protein D
MENPVGPILRTSDDVDLVVAAIEDDNPDVEIEVIDHGSYVRIQAEDYLRVSAESLRRYLGADFETRSLEGMLTSFAGRINTNSDFIEWSLGRHPAPAATSTPASAGRGD